MADSLVSAALSAYDEHRRSNDREADTVRGLVRQRAVVWANEMLGFLTTKGDWNVRGDVATYKAEGLELSVDTSEFVPRFTVKGVEDEEHEVTSLADVGELLAKKDVVPADSKAKAKVTRAT